MPINGASVTPRILTDTFPGAEPVLPWPETLRENEEVVPVNISTWVLPLGVMVGP